MSPRFVLICQDCGVEPTSCPSCGDLQCRCPCPWSTDVRKHYRRDGTPYKRELRSAAREEP